VVPAAGDIGDCACSWAGISIVQLAINSNAESLARGWMSVRFIMRQAWISTSSGYDIAMVQAAGTKKVENTFNSLAIEFEAV